MNKYEVLYILRADLEEGTTRELIDRFSGVITTGGGTVEETDTEHWGKRRLAYPINYMNDGYYVLTRFSAPPALPSELERNFRINDNVIRYMVTRVAE